METLQQVVMVLVPMILSLSVHEFAHAWAAFKLGDDTAARQGRMTLNPVAHIDPIGTLLLPIILVATNSGFFFGWAKPVPVAPYRFKRGISMRNGMIITSLAGPFSNIILAFISSGVLTFLLQNNIVSNSQGSEALMTGLFLMFKINIILAVFNMIPIPPLDGSRLLPERLLSKAIQYQMFVFMGLLVLINVFSDLLAVPMDFIEETMLSFWRIIL